jgi:hypothetical protein
MYAQPANTVRAQRARPLLTCRDISGNEASGFYGQLLGYFDAQHASNAQKFSIGDIAVQFYMLNHGIALIDNGSNLDEQLSPEQAALYSNYHAKVGQIGVRMIYDIVFMLTAMTSTTHPDGYHLEVVENSQGAAARSFVEALTGKTGNVSFWTPDYKSLRHVLTTAQKQSEGLKLGDAIRAMGYILDVRQRELSYGPLWRDIARMAASYFEGHKSLETTIDTSFTFCHCNGSFFEKGKLFTAVGNDLFKALDVQRSGQIPQFVNEGKNPLTRAPATRALHAQFAKAFPEVFNAKVDWSIVKEVTRNQLVFTAKYATHWNARMGAAAAHNEPPKPKIFSPIDEGGYLNIIKGI